MSPSLVATAAHLGQLDGSLRMLDTDCLDSFAFERVRTALIGSLDEAGFADAPHRFPGWLSGDGPPPQITLTAAAAPETVCRVVLERLKASRWQPVAAAAEFTLRAAPQLTRSPNPPEDIETLERAQGEAQAIINGTTRSEELGFAWLTETLAEAVRTPQFAPLQRDTRALRVGSRILLHQPAMPRTHSWLLSLAASDALCRHGHLARPVPLLGSIPAEALRLDYSADARLTVALRALDTAVLAALAALDRTRRRINAASAQLAHCRTTSRALAAYGVLDGLGGLRRNQLSLGFGITLVGCDRITGTLTAAGLVNRATPRGPFTPCPTTEPTIPPGPPAAHSPGLSVTALAEFESAMADLDHLLERQIGQ